MLAPRLALFRVGCLWLLSGATLVFSQEAAISDVRVGAAGHFKRGHWAEVTALVQAGAVDLEGELEVVSRDGDGAPAAFVCPQPLRLTSGKSARFTTLVKMGPPRSGLQLRIRAGEKTIVQLEVVESTLNGAWNASDKTSQYAHRSTAQVIGVLGPPIGVDASLELLRRYYADEVAAVSLSGADLPTSWRGYDALDCLVIVAAEQHPLGTVSAEQRHALLDWLHLGGCIVVVAGNTAGELATPESPWASLLPGRLSPHTRLTTEAGLHAFTGEPVELEPVPQVWQWESSRSFTVLSETGSATSHRPLIVEAPVGLGRVSVVLVELTQPPLAEWKGRARLLGRVITGTSLAGGQGDVARGGGRMTHLGYRDLAGQLRMALDQYAGVSPVHFYPVAGVLLIYLLLLGPGEYFLLRKAAPLAMHLTWVAFPLLVVAFASGAVLLGQSSRGSELRINHVEIVDLDLTHGRQRGTSWTSLFTPESQSFSLSALPAKAIPEAKLRGTQFAWQALPGDGLGGVDAALPINILPLSTASPEPYRVRSGDADSPAIVQSLPLVLASSKMLAASWWGTLPAAAPETSGLHRGKLRDLEGSFRNLAPVALKNAYLAYGESIYRARDEIAPGATINILQLEQKHLEFQFTRRRLLKDADFSTPWNQEETEIPRILDIMMFHAAVQGRNYTVLSHRYQPELDFTYLIKHGYAVLVGQSETPLLELQQTGQPVDEASVRRWTFYRLVYPVAAANAVNPPATGNSQ